MPDAYVALATTLQFHLVGPDGTPLLDAVGTAALVGPDAAVVFTGRPFTALVSRDNANVLASVDRPNVVGDPFQAGPIAGNPTCAFAPPAQLRTPSAWFNPCAFALAPAGTFGNEGRNNLIAPSWKNLDVVMSRVFHIWENVFMQLRVEAFNAFNHPNFDLPVQTFDNASFGSIPAAEAARQLQFGLKLRF